MKNIFLIPTDKPSRLHLAYDKDYYLSVESFIQLDTKNYKSFNLYITSDEEIKVGDWYYLPRTNSVYKCNEDATELNLERRLGVGKIILTTDQDLIKDGIQVTSNEFLEWFVKNPSCEFVDIQQKDNYY